jgi:hypothetical protein
MEKYILLQQFRVQFHIYGHYRVEQQVLQLQIALHLPSTEHTAADLFACQQ